MMVNWHEKIAARIGLRLAGAVVLWTAWLSLTRLHALVHSHSPREPSSRELVLCSVVMLLLVLGNALLVFGSGLWKEVELPIRRGLSRAGEEQLDFTFAGEDGQPSSISDEAEVIASNVVAARYCENTMGRAAPASRYQTRS
ncbi:hypothetical protein [Novosphingobium silvae]|uniref:hypothetical protein n=1 Tax=Novosphingobium silvae TaxID=2692619 RepID=UPI0019255E79|nr:hypothetical protein [Novosphingobium silvae]